MKWCDTHQIRYHADDDQCPLCSSSIDVSVDAGASRGEA